MSAAVSYLANSPSRLANGRRESGGGRLATANLFMLVYVQKSCRRLWSPFG